MRIYVPSTLPALATAAKQGDLVMAGTLAHAVTPALREWYAESDAEELEHAAFLDAARTSLRRLAADPGAVRARVVVSADVADLDAVPAAGPDAGDDERSVVLLSSVVPLSAVASIHIDEQAAIDDVTAAVLALGAAGRGDEDAQFVVDGAEGHDLLWYDVSELDELLAGRG